MKKITYIKRTFCVAVVLCFCIFLAACNKGKKTTTTAPVTEMHVPNKEILAGAQDYYEIFGDYDFQTLKGKTIDIYEKIGSTNVNVNNYPFLYTYGDVTNSKTYYVVTPSDEIVELGTYIDSSASVSNPTGNIYLAIKKFVASTETSIAYYVIDYFDLFGNKIVTINSLYQNNNSITLITAPNSSCNYFYEVISYYPVIDGIASIAYIDIYFEVQTIDANNDGIKDSLTRTSVPEVNYYNLRNIYSYSYKAGDIIRTSSYSGYERLGYSEISERDFSIVFDENMEIIFEYNDYGAEYPCEIGMMGDKVFVQVLETTDEHSDDYDFVNYESKTRVKTYCVDMYTGYTKEIKDFKYAVEDVTPIYGRKAGDTKDSVVALYAMGYDITNKTAMNARIIYFTAEGEMLNESYNQYFGEIYKLDATHYIYFDGNYDCWLLDEDGKKITLIESDYDMDNLKFGIDKENKIIFVSEYSEEYDTYLVGICNFDGKLICEFKYTMLEPITKNSYMAYDINHEMSILLFKDGTLVSEVKDFSPRFEEVTDSIYYDGQKVNSKQFINNSIVTVTSKMKTIDEDETVLYDVVITTIDGTEVITLTDLLEINIESNYPNNQYDTEYFSIKYLKYIDDDNSKAGYIVLK